MTGLPHRKTPCKSCPWRRDHEPGTFGVDRYQQLAATCASDQGSAGLGSPMFACHLAPDGAEQACAGWLAVEGHGHVGVRFAVATGRIPADALAPGVGWPDLWESYGEMVEHVAGPPGACGIPAPPGPDTRGNR